VPTLYADTGLVVRWQNAESRRWFGDQEGQRVACRFEQWREVRDAGFRALDTQQVVTLEAPTGTTLYLPGPGGVVIHHEWSQHGLAVWIARLAVDLVRFRIQDLPHPMPPLEEVRSDLLAELAARGLMRSVPVRRPG
jgi:hypothetical protein